MIDSSANNFCRKVSESALGVVIQARGCHIPAIDCHTDVNWKESSQETVLGIFSVSLNDWF